MNLDSNIVVIDDAPPDAVALRAGKVQVLGLAPFKARLGAKWSRLSDLVHKLFESAIRHVQGPSDHFIAIDELSYVVTFRDLSLEETTIACVAIAREVCQLLFGNEIDEVAVRSLVSAVVVPREGDLYENARKIEAALETGGTETIVAQSIQTGSPVVFPSEKVQPNVATPVEEIARARAELDALGLRLGFFPVWELRKASASSLFLVPFIDSFGRRIAIGRRALGGMTDQRIEEIEVGLLRAASAYASHLRREGRICAVGIGISYSTLCVFRARIRFITALQKVETSPSSPLLLKIEQVPEGVPVARIAELVAMFRFPNVRVIVEFQDLAKMPELDVRVGAIGYGGAIPSAMGRQIALQMVERLVRRASAQKAFAFLDCLDSEGQLADAQSRGVRFGTGEALSMSCLTGLEPVPAVPLTLSTAFGDRL